ncbi:cupredoxin domain-containing protein [Candidatus Uhrbacteria bacterium]|nr:cupredoxin domain-containing protein [Candidatus Uhrbacteria bacterium]
MHIPRSLALIAMSTLFLGAGCSSTTPPAPADTASDAPVSMAPTAPSPTVPPPEAAAPIVPPAPPDRGSAVATTPPPAVQTPPPAKPTPATRAFRITARQWAFTPAEIRVGLGDRVVLDIASTDVDHGIAIPEFGMRKELKAGTTTRVEFTASKAGSFSFVCSVFCGQDHRNMRGSLIVEAKK